MTDGNRRWALVTGATGGLGRAFCAALARRGYSLVLTARDHDALASLAAGLEAAHAISTHVVAIDLADPSGCEQLKREVDARGIAVETLVNNAGFGVHGRFASQPLDRLTGMVDVNIRALTELTRLFADDMARRGGGHILLVSSTAAFQPIPGYAVYAATKSYVLSLGYALHEELRRKKVVVTVLCPGPTETHFWSRAKHRLNPVTARMLMQPEPVVEAGLAALYRGRHGIVTGASNNIVTFLSRLFPRVLLAKGAEVFMSKASGDKPD